MSLKITAKTITFLPDEREHNYVVDANPAYKKLNIKVEGEYEIAITGLESHAFAQELVLEPDTTYSPPRIVKMIRIRKKTAAKEGKITHRLGTDAQALYISLHAEEVKQVLEKNATPSGKIEAKPITPIMPPISVAEKKAEPTVPPKPEQKKETPIVPPKVETPLPQPLPPIPKVTSQRKEVFFTKIVEGIVSSELLEIQSEHLDKIQLSVAAPFRLSSDNRTFSQVLTLQMHRKGDTKQVYVQVLAPKSGNYQSNIICKHGDKTLHTVFVKAICHKDPNKADRKAKKAFPIRPITLATSLLCVLALGWWIWGNRGATPQNTTSATVLSTSNLALPVDPACKPSLYQKLKEKTGAIRYSCVDKNCDTAFVREILTYASGSKAFKYVSVHTAETPDDCGAWVDNLFKNNEIDLIYTEKPCNIGNIDISSSLCEDKKCVFVIPCGNSEGFLKVLNKEIRRRKAEKMKAALRIVRDEWKRNS